MDYEFLTVEKKSRVATCTILRPPMNYMNAKMLTEVDAVARDAESDPEVRVLMYTGGLDGIFITHYDVAELSAAAEGQSRGPRPPDVHEVFNRLGKMPIVTIAALNGTAMGGGCEMSLACDFRLMSDGPFRYGLPETGVGIIPGAGGTQRMARLLGRAAALDLILHGRVMEPQEALALGLVHRVFPADEFAAQAFEFAENLARRAPIALAAAKEAIREGIELSLEDGLELEQRAFARTMRSSDARNAMKAWLEGKPYEFEGE